MSLSTHHAEVARTPLAGRLFPRPIGWSQERWASCGFCVADEALPLHLVEELRRRVDAVVQGRFEIARPPLLYRPGCGPGADAGLNHIEMHSHVHWCDSLMSSIALDPQLGAFAAALLGVRAIRLWGTSVIYKHSSPEARNDVAWHRDMSFWQCVSQPRMLTFWIALDDTSTENGCLEFAVGSHRAGRFGDDSDLATFMTEPGEMRRGQISIHHCLTGHRSGCNRSGSPRRAFTIHVMDADLRYVPDSPSDNHMNVCLIGKTEDAPIGGQYFPLIFPS